MNYASYVFVMFNLYSGEGLHYRCKLRLIVSKLCIFFISYKYKIPLCFCCRAPGSEAKPQSTASRLLLFLVVLFALATIALSVVLAVTVLRVKDNDKGKAK